MDRVIQKLGQSLIIRHFLLLIFLLTLSGLLAQTTFEGFEYQNPTNPLVNKHA